MGTTGIIVFLGLLGLAVAILFGVQVDVTERCGCCGGDGITTNTVTCSTCSGDGRVSCDVCGGDGRIAYGLLTCTNCGGSGELTCSSCGGRGYKTVESTCGCCGGRGYSRHSISLIESLFM